MSRVILLLSGGIDSVACLHRAVSEGHSVYPLFVDYGQPQEAREREAALRACARVEVALRVMSVRDLVVPSTGYIPARNLVFVSLAANYAYIVAATELWAGILPGGLQVPESPQFFFGQSVWFPQDVEEGLTVATKGLFIRDDNSTVTLVDESGEVWETSRGRVWHSEEACLKGIADEEVLLAPSYPDTTTEFITTFNEVLKSGVSSDTPLRLVAPFTDKVSVVRYAYEMGVPLDSTWSCWSGDSTPCGVCKACVDLAVAKSLVGA